MSRQSVQDPLLVDEGSGITQRFMRPREWSRDAVEPDSPPRHRQKEDDDCGQIESDVSAEEGKLSEEEQMAGPHSTEHGTVSIRAFSQTDLEKVQGIGQAAEELIFRGQGSSTVFPVCQEGSWGRGFPIKNLGQFQKMDQSRYTLRHPQTSRS